MFVVDDKKESAGGVKGALLSLKETWDKSPVVESTKSWLWWAFKKGGTVTWIVTTTGMVVAFPLIFQVERDIAIGEAETQQIQQLQQQGYNQAQIAQMMGQAPPAQQ
uniref:Mitochondrial import receptor subunit TOM22 n=1 Tax=Mucochytrium quahogii TaxID=96639 RepID=A0A7S2S419_9STRA|mmetsp:Transcript_6594/g.10402  ORF Transcript_6594/g.10402 Transcript_6594/m.10402 type:complete len:107 (+) Transcript_6594:28-348(+)